jgi:hypothetical protein
MFTQMFKAAAPENVRHLLSHKDQTRLMVEEAYKIYFTDHRLDMDMRPEQVHAIAGDPEAAHSINRTSLLSGHNKGNKTEVPNRISTTGATTVQVDKATDPTTTTATVKIPTSPNPML